MSTWVERVPDPPPMSQTQRALGYVATTIILMVLALFVFSLIGAAPAKGGEIYDFSAITANSSADVATGQAQLSVEVSDGGLLNGSNTALFTFRNAGPALSSITQIDFDDGSLLALGSIINGSGTSFRYANPQPGVLPGGNTIDFNPTTGFSVEPFSPMQPNGVNPGEWVTLRYILQSGKTYADTISALNLGLTDITHDLDGGLRIGIHVQGFADGQSESFVDAPLTNTPEPSTMIMAATALIPLGFMGLRRIRRKA